MREVKGPITLIAGKARRLTFLECPQDLSAMIDAGEWGWEDGVAASTRDVLGQPPRSYHMLSGWQL